MPNIFSILNTIAMRNAIAICEMAGAPIASATQIHLDRCDAARRAAAQRAYARRCQAFDHAWTNKIKAA